MEKREEKLGAKRLSVNELNIESYKEIEQKDFENLLFGLVKNEIKTYWELCKVSLERAKECGENPEKYIEALSEDEEKYRSSAQEAIVTSKYAETVHGNLPMIKKYLEEKKRGGGRVKSYKFYENEKGEPVMVPLKELNKQKNSREKEESDLDRLYM